MSRRLSLALIALLAAVAGALALAAGGGAQVDVRDGPAAGAYRVDAIFDTAKGIVPGQTVKIAGARVGEVADVGLTPDARARIELRIDERFRPFRADARCSIQPEGLLSENFVQCDPGTQASPPLRARGDAAPTVALQRTSVPVSLTDLFEVWRVPVRDRLGILLSSLGAGVAARGEDLNALLRRANPTLGAVHDVVGTLDHQKRELQAALTDAEQVTRELVREPGEVREAIDAFADASTVTARRGEELRAGVRELPATLDALRPALRRLDSLSREGTPLARRLALAAPQTTRVLEAIPPAARRAGPAVRALGTTARRARPAVRTARPLVRRLARFAGAALPTGDELSRLLDDLRDEDAVRHLLSFIYRAGAATSRFDATSHLLPSGVVINNCGLFATTTDPACDANYTRTAATADRRSKDRRQSARRPAAAREPEAPAAAPAPAPDRGPATPEPAKPVLPLPKLPETLDRVQRGTEALLDLLLAP